MYQKQPKNSLAAYSWKPTKDQEVVIEQLNMTHASGQTEYMNIKDMNS